MFKGQLKATQHLSRAQVLCPRFQKLRVSVGGSGSLQFLPLAAGGPGVSSYPLILPELLSTSVLPRDKAGQETTHTEQSQRQKCWGGGKFNVPRENVPQKPSQRLHSKLSWGNSAGKQTETAGMWSERSMPNFLSISSEDLLQGDSPPWHFKHGRQAWDMQPFVKLRDVHLAPWLAQDPPDAWVSTLNAAPLPNDRPASVPPALHRCPSSAMFSVPLFQSRKWEEVEEK